MREKGNAVMGVLSNRVDRAQIKAGDHIYSWRAAYTYSHHGNSVVSAILVSGFLFLFAFLLSIVCGFRN